MSAGFFKRHDHQVHNKAKTDQTPHPAKVVHLFPQTNVDRLSKQRAPELQRKEELNDAARYQNSIRALLQQTKTAAPRPSLFQAPKPTPKPTKGSVLFDIFDSAPTLDLNNAPK